MEAKVAIPPVQRPLPRRLRVPQPRDREPGPLRPNIRTPRRPALHDRQVPGSQVHLDTHLIAHMLRNPSTAPPLNTRDIDLSVRGMDRAIEIAGKLAEAEFGLVEVREMTSQPSPH